MVLMRSAPWLLTLVMCSAATAADDHSLAGARPNIVLVMTDDQGYGPVGRHGHPWIQTPNLDSLYDTSVRFTRFLVSPDCAPTRSALMTGRHPMRNGVTHTILERERMTLEATTLPQVLKTAGYTTGIFGKWHLGDEEPYQPHNRGFDEAFIHGAGGIGQAYDCSCADAPGNKYFDPVIRHNGSFVQDARILHGRLLHRRHGLDQAVPGRRAPRSSPTSPPTPRTARSSLRPRTPSDSPTWASARSGRLLRHDREHRRERGAACCRSSKQWNLLEDTLIIFMSDNGMTGRRLRTAGQRWVTPPTARRCCPTTPA